MIKQSLRYAVAGAGLATALVGATQHAQATNSASLSANGSVPYLDIGVLPAGTTLQASVNINFAGAGSDITVSNSGAFTNKLEWKCGTSGVINALNTNGFNDVNFSDISGFCSFGTPVSWAKSTINDV